MHDTWPLLRQSDFPPVTRSVLDTLQVNLGYLCNQACEHCHVDAGPKRREIMASETVDVVIDFFQRVPLRTLDLTGGAPEMNPHFRRLVAAATAAGLSVIDRCNLTILSEPGYEDMAAFLAEHRVQVVASLPCYLEDNVDRQRGNGVFQASLAGLRQLNALGYGRSDAGLELNLVYNPQGPALPPPQEALEADYRRVLKANYGVEFNRLYALTNMPIQRFGSTLVSKGQFDDYLRLLKDNFSPATMDSLMCRSHLSVDWQGFVYDCDFNQMLNLDAPLNGGGKVHLRDVAPRSLAGQRVATAQHCYGCTAGQGSSCGGAIN